MKMKELFELLGHPYQTMTLNEPIDVSAHEMEIRSFDTEAGMQTWQLIRRIVRKQRTDSYVVSSPGRIERLVVSPEHLFWARVSGSEPHWIEAHALVGNDFELFWADGSCWIPATVQHTVEQTDILDVEVDGTHCYYTDGVLSHNTMYGDPLVTPGGNAIPFHSSVRVRLGSGARLVDPKTKEQYGIKVIATVIKNKVARPNRKVEFEIHFGKGIVEHEQILDIVRSHCKAGPVLRGDKALAIEGDGAWKTLSVCSEATGEVLIEKKFVKNDFEWMLKDDAYSPFIHEILDDAMVKGGASSAVVEGSDDSEASSPKEAPAEDA